MKMKKLAYVALAVAAVSNAAFAATVEEANDSAIWNVTAEKDSLARLVVQPQGGIVFQYAKNGDGTTGTFPVQDAAFTVMVDGTDLTGVTGFTLAAQAAPQSQVNDGAGSTMDVQLNAGVEPLTSSGWVTLVDGSAASYAGLEGITGLSGGIENGQAAFQATLTNFMAAGASVPTATDMPDGLYTGVVGANFRATWDDGI